MDNIVVVDGDIVHGGGQILRNSSAYAAILGKSVHFKNIRVNRPRPGLRPQYLEGLKAVAKLSASKLEYAFVDSQEVYFVGAASDALVSITDKKSSAQKIHTNDAAISLLLQALLPVLLFSPTSTDLVFTGGAKMLVSPSVDYMKHVLVPLLALVCRLLIYAETTTGCILGGGSTIPRDRHNVSSSPKELASSAVLDLEKQLAHGGCTDEYLQDQLVIFMALADGVSEIVTGPITPHTRSAIEIAEHMTDAKFEVTLIAHSSRNVIRCEGTGHFPQTRQQTSSRSVFLTCTQHRKQDFGDMIKPVRAT